MDEVEERLVRNNFEERMRPSLANLVPANVRHNLVAAEASHLPPQQIQSGRASKLFRFFKEHLHAHAHAQQGRAIRDLLPNKFIKAARGKRFYACSESA